MNQKLIDEIIDAIYVELFKNSSPSADFNELVKSGEAKKPNFFLVYYLNQNKQDKIIDTVLKKFKIRDIWDLKGFRTEVNLGCSPNSCEKTWKEYRSKLKEKILDETKTNRMC